MKIGKWPLLAVAAAAVAVAVVVGVARRKPSREFKLSTDPDMTQARKLLASLYVQDDAGLVRFLNYDAELMDLPENIAAAVSKHRDGEKHLAVAELMTMLEEAADVTPARELEQFDDATLTTLLREGYVNGGIEQWVGWWWHTHGNEHPLNMTAFRELLAERIK